MEVIKQERLRRSGKPVLVAWTREEEIFYDTFDPAAVVEALRSLLTRTR